MLISKLQGYFASELSRVYRNTERHFVTITLIATIANPIRYLYDYYNFNVSFDTQWYRLALFCVCIGMLLAYRAPSMRQRMPLIYWLGLTAYTVFMYEAMLFGNAANSGSMSELGWEHIAQTFIGLFIFVTLMPSIVLTIVGWVAGSMLALLCTWVFIDPINWDMVSEVFFRPLALYTTVIIVGSIAHRQAETVQTEKAEAAKAIGGNIAHELRTPLSGISARASAAQKLLPELTQGYQRAVEAGLTEQPIPGRQLRLLSTALSDIEREAEFSNTVINMLLTNIAERPFEQMPRERFSVSALILESVERYPFHGSRERELVRLELDEDFEVDAPRPLVMHVLWNLVKNALYHVQKANKGDIELRVCATERLVLVRDTGPGIAASALPRIFERFYTTASLGRGSGIGLSFCAEVMAVLGGEIVCESVEGSHTEFKLAFPALGPVEVGEASK